MNILNLLYIKTVYAATNTDFKSTVFCGADKICKSYDEWVQGVWGFALKLIIPLSILMLAAAGVIWMTSEGNPDRISLAKKLIYGVVSGVALIFLARILLIDVMGIDGSSWLGN